MTSEGSPRRRDDRTGIERISAVTLFVRDMSRALAFYEALGFALRYGGHDARFTSLDAGDGGYLNLALDAHEAPERRWGRIIFYVGDVDAFHERAVAAGIVPDGRPADAPWGERYFHVADPDGHELSFARPLDRRD
jgi:catechol 2,3-dioxygenase-like lactoylglutathione lyase family enzyme